MGARRRFSRPGPLAGAWSSREIIISEDVSGRTVLLQLATGTYLGLDRSAATIVGLLNEDPDQELAARALAARYGIPLEQARADVASVVASVQGMTARRTSRGRRPTLIGVRVVAASWGRLTWRYRITTAWVTVIVVVIETGLKVTSVATLARWLQVPLATDNAPPPASGPDDLSDLTPAERRMYWSVHWVLSRWLYDGTCLRRALALGWFLRAHHPRLRLGVMDDEGTVAHAWIEVGGRAYNTQPVTKAFTHGGIGDGPREPGSDDPTTSGSDGFL
jgi:hypothetical protein